MSTKIEQVQTGLVLSQPMLLPWIGMFEQVRLCNHFVFYDDVQLPLGGGRGRGFITRVQIKTPRGIDWLSLPVARAGKGMQLISDSLFPHMSWKQEHLGKIVQAYRCTPFFSEIFERVVKPIYSIETHCLSDFCMQSMEMVWHVLGLAPKKSISSQLSITTELNSSERILAICKKFGINNYISGSGAMNYIDYELFDLANVKIYFMNYALESYPQEHGDFTPYVSIIDPLFNIGIEGVLKKLNSKAIYWKNWPYYKDGRPIQSNNFSRDK
jgi:hypothetical protein